MELPFYLNFSEFKKSYYDDLEKWFQVYHNTSEIDFLNFLAELYRPYVYYNFAQDSLCADASITIKEYFFPSHEKIGLSFYNSFEKIDFQKKVNSLNPVFEWKTITMMEYAQHILDKINEHISKIYHREYTNVLDFINSYEVITYGNGEGFRVNYHQHQITIPFLKAYLPCYGQTVDIAKYKDFISSIELITNFIDDSLRSVEAYEKTVFAKLKSKSKFEIHMNHQFLTICN